MIRGMENFSCQGRIKGFGVVQAGEEKVPGQICSSISVANGESWTELLTQGHVGVGHRIMNGPKLKDGRFRLYIRKKSFIMRLVRQWMPHTWQCSRPGWTGF